MTTIQIVLGLSALGAGLFTGIIAAMVGVIQRVLNTLSAEAYTPVMQGIIRSGRRSVLVWLCLLVPLFSGLIGVVLLWNERGSLSFMLALSAYVVFIIGPVGLSRLFNEPLYDRILRWSTEGIPANWQFYRNRWYQFNLLRLSTALVACCLYLIAFLQV